MITARCRFRPMNALVTIGVVLVGLVVLGLVLKALWRVAEPNEALIISGFRARSSPGETADSLGFKIVTGKGTLVIPGFRAARRLSLDTRGANLQVSCVTKQSIPVAVRGVVIYKVGDGFVPIANAARRFLDQQNTMNNTIHELFAGHLRPICGGLTIEDMIHNREALTGEVRRSSADEMSKLGLVIDSPQIQEIDDSSGYIVNLGKPHAAAIAAAARIAEAQRDQEATEAEQIAEAKAAKAKGLAEAEAMQARSDALAQNQEAVIAQQLAENWPEIVKAGAGALGNVDHMVVLNGADGMADLLTKTLAMGGTGLGLARKLLGAMSDTPAPGAGPARTGRAVALGSPVRGLSVPGPRLAGDEPRNPCPRTVRRRDVR